MLGAAVFQGADPAHPFDVSFPPLSSPPFPNLPLPSPFLILPFPSPPGSARQVQIGDLRSGVSFPSWVRDRAPAAKKSFLVYSEPR